MSTVLDKIFKHKSDVCPWWLCWSFDNPFRKLIQNPYKILSPFVCEGDIVSDVGCGMGYFSIPMAHMVGQNGKVVAIDLQERMLEGLLNRARKKGLSERIITCHAESDSILYKDKVDFALAFWMVHEVPDRKKMFKQVCSILKKNSKLLFAEPVIHVSEKSYHESLNFALSEGLIWERNVGISLSHACLLKKK